MIHPDKTHRLVVVGGGIAGLEIATAFGRRLQRQRGPGIRIEPTLVDRDWAHVWKPMLHTLAAGTRDIATQQTPFLAQARDAGFRFEPGELCGLDRARRLVRLAPTLSPDGQVVVPARQVAYDTLVIAVGSQANDFGTPGVAAHCWKIDSRLQADAFNAALRTEMLRSLAEGRPLSIAIVGGGATGVELAAELVLLAETAASYGASHAVPALRLTLVESGPRLLAAFPRDISSATRDRLAALGVKVMMERRVVSADASGFVLEGGERVDASLRVWAAGVKAPEVLSRLDGLEATRNHQLVVDPSLRTTVDDAVLAVGDCASLVAPGAERPLPPTAQVAHQQAQFLVRHLPGRVRRGEPLPPFRARDMGSLVALGDHDAFGSLGRFGIFSGLVFRGAMARAGHALLYRSHQARLHGPWRGAVLWLAEHLQGRVHGRIRLA
jgi:NADH:ubiquinone reductase (H+-translocating)